MSVFSPLCEIAIPPRLATSFFGVQPQNRITNLAKLNVFVSPNNSGKSRLIRELFGCEELCFSLRTSLNQSILAHSKELADVLKTATANEFAAELSARLKDIYPVLHTAKGVYQITAEQNNLNNSVGAKIGSHNSELRAIFGSEKEAYTSKLVSLCENISVTRTDKGPETQLLRIYIPTLRGLRFNSSVGCQDYYFRQTRCDYFQNIPDNPEDFLQVRIFTGADVYRLVQSYLLGPLAQRESIRQFEEFLGAAFFEGRQVALIPRLGAELHVKIGDEAEQPIHSIGDGIQQMIILTLPIFLHRGKQLLLFIEEPELFLHPGLQRKLIDLILDDANTGLQVFVATHSHQFLDITIDREKCSVYRLRKSLPGEGRERVPHVNIENVSNDDRNLLLELGVRNSSVFLSNCTIWVEGVTDRLYLRKYLAIFQEEQEKKYMEDLHFSFVEYGGSNITHFSFLDEEGIDVERLCGELLLIADKDSAKDERHERLSRTLGDRYEKLTVREIENLLSPAVIRSTIEGYESKQMRFAEFEQADYIDEKLGDFIENKVLTNISDSTRKNDPNNRPYADKYGKIKDKPNFCNRAIKFVNRDTISRDAFNLAKRIYEFIASRNSGAIGNNQMQQH